MGTFDAFNTNLIKNMPTKAIGDTNNVNSKETVKTTPAVQNANLPKAKLESPQNDILVIKQDFEKLKKNNGLSEKFYNYLKNKTNFGLGSKKIENQITEFENQKITKDELDKSILNYKKSQKSAEQNTGNLAAAALTISTYFLMENQRKRLMAKLEVNESSIFKEFIEGAPKKIKKIIETALNLSKTKTKFALLLAPVLFIIGGNTKMYALNLNRIGSKEYKYEKDKNLDKKANKKAKKEVKKARRKANFKNFLTGGISGLLAPMTGVLSGIVGVPAYLASVLALDSLTKSKDVKDKTTNEKLETLKNNWVLNSAFALAIAVPAFKKAKFSSVLETNLKKVVANLKNVKLHYTPGTDSTAFSKLEKIMMESPEIQEILGVSENSIYRVATVSEKVSQLIEKNIFAAKFAQITKHYGEISTKLIEDCPPSRTLEEAKDEITKLWGSKNFEVSKCLGVGTVAETYLAKDLSNGKEVCIKIIKRGIDAQKIEQDKQAFIKLVTKGKPLNQLNKEQEFLLKSIDDLAEGISKEVNLENELEAAKKLKQYTKKANVVVPIEAKNGIYVMEKAPGISLQTLNQYFNEKGYLYYCEKKLQKATDERDKSFYKWQVERIKENVDKIKSKSPDFEDFDFSVSDIKQMLYNYIDVIAEQFSSINKNGKTIHADIHPGNIFVDINALKNRQQKIFTLIDTGNTIDLSKDQALSSLKIISYVNNGNYKDMAKTLLHDAILPSGMTQEKAISLIENDLKEILFDNKTALPNMNLENAVNLVNNIARKHNIITCDTQLNLNKAKTSAKHSFENLVDSFFSEKTKDVDYNDKINASKAAVGAIKDAGLIFTKYAKALKTEEYKSLLKCLSIKELISRMRNKNQLKTNSEEYLTYKLKQVKSKMVFSEDSF